MTVGKMGYKNIVQKRENTGTHFLLFHNAVFSTEDQFSFESFTLLLAITFSVDRPGTWVIG